ncbi:MAG: 3-hydroxyacyl-ACP dehydratase, partial [Flavihumibacter sp.]
MILTGDFCKVTGLQAEEGRWKAQLHWNADHAIFGGHFPGQPVVPGVCMIQMVQEVMETALGRRMQLVSSGSIKFLQFI